MLTYVRSSKHMKKHTRPYTCRGPNCGLAFEHSNDRNRHENDVHSDMRVKYYCVYPGCQTKLAREGGRKDNVRRHIGGIHGGHGHMYSSRG